MALATVLYFIGLTVMIGVVFILLLRSGGN